MGFAKFLPLPLQAKPDPRLLQVLPARCGRLGACACCWHRHGTSWLAWVRGAQLTPGRGQPLCSCQAPWHALGKEEVMGAGDGIPPVHGVPPVRGVPPARPEPAVASGCLQRCSAGPGPTAEGLPRPTSFPIFPSSAERSGLDASSCAQGRRLQLRLAVQRPCAVCKRTGTCDFHAV